MARLPGQIDPLPPDDPALRLRRIVDEQGRADAAQVADLGLSPEELKGLFRGMLLIRVMDERLLGMQRQGRIGFYGEARGQEAAVIGTAAALSAQDFIVPALREAGAAIFRGLPLRAYIAQIMGNANDLSLGHQMPCHPGSRASRYVTMSSCVGTQIPHAVGMAMAARRLGEEVVVAGYLGDGATSQADFHVALNFAGVFRAPVVFVCQNNQWAISTPSSVQSATETMAQKAVAYGVPFLRADGNDVLACYAAMKEAAVRARGGGGPTLLEALTYRVSAHSSSDDPSRYRDESVTRAWLQRDPLQRYQKFLHTYGLLQPGEAEALRASLEEEVRAAVAAEEAQGPPPLATLVQGVYAEVPRALQEQLDEIAALPRQGHGE